MRVLLLFAILVFSSLSVFSANNNPWMRSCRIEQGQFWLVKAQKELALCLFDDAAIGAETLFLYKTNQKKPLAVAAYLNRESAATRGGVCGTYDAELLEARDGQGQSFNLCKFQDGSFIEETTLWLGPDSGSTDALDKALSTKY